MQTIIVKIRPNKETVGVTVIAFALTEAYHFRLVQYSGLGQIVIGFRSAIKIHNADHGAVYHIVMEALRRINFAVLQNRSLNESVVGHVEILPDFGCTKHYMAYTVSVGLTVMGRGSIKAEEARSLLLVSHHERSERTRIKIHHEVAAGTDAVPFLARRKSNINSPPSDASIKARMQDYNSRTPSSSLIKGFASPERTI